MMLTCKGGRTQTVGKLIRLTDAYILEGCAGLSQFSNRLKAVMTPGAKLVLYVLPLC